MKNKTIIIGVSSSIAAYKAIDIVSYFRKQNHDVFVIMTKNATEFVSPITFQTLSNNPVSVDTFDKLHQHATEHISLAKKADVFCIVPATANIIAKIANGIADDMLTTTFLACDCPKIICPAMNTKMYNNPINQKNINACIDYGMKFVDSDSGMLACGDIGKGKLANIEDIIDMIEYSLYPNIFENKKILITAGGTQEAIDPVRIITNHSSGKMGFAIGKMARALKAQVTIIAANTNIRLNYDINKIEVTTAEDMFNTIKNIYQEYDYIIMASAVSDYTPCEYQSQKIKKTENELIIKLKKTNDILSFLGQNHNKNQILCGFAMESENLEANATKKLLSKNCDLIVANNINTKGAGFNVDTNVATIISKNNIQHLDIMSKEELGLIILQNLKEIKDATND